MKDDDETKYDDDDTVVDAVVVSGLLVFALAVTLGIAALWWYL